MNSAAYFLEFCILISFPICDSAAVGSMGGSYREIESMAKNPLFRF
jgi:hypothetical protein